MLVYRTIRRYLETGSIEKRYGGGRKKTATTPKMVRNPKARMDRNPRQSARKLAKQLKISDRSVRRMLKNNLGVKPYKIQKAHNLTEKQKKMRLQRAKELKRLHANGDLPNIVFSDEKNYTVEQFVNKQNDRVWLRERSGDNLNLRLATKTQAPAHVMVWAAVTADGRSPLVFLNAGVKVNATVYRECVLEGVLKPWADSHFGNRPYTFQQDSAPSHKARVNQEWLRQNVPHFISTEQWPSNSPDANPLDFSFGAFWTPKS